MTFKAFKIHSRKSNTDAGYVYFTPSWSLCPAFVTIKQHEHVFWKWTFHWCSGRRRRKSRRWWDQYKCWRCCTTECSTSTWGSHVRCNPLSESCCRGPRKWETQLESPRPCRWLSASASGLFWDENTGSRCSSCSRRYKLKEAPGRARKKTPSVREEGCQAAKLWSSHSKLWSLG